MKNRYYIVEKNNSEIVHGYIDYRQIQGFKIKPGNNVPYDGVEVSHLTLVEPELIKKVLIKKTKRKLNTYLNFLMAIIEDDDTDEGALALVIEDAERYKRIIIEKYSKFLDKSYIRSLLRRLNVVEKKLNEKMKSLVSENEAYIGRRR